MSQPRPRPCIVCGVRVVGGSRCARHKTGSGRLRPCLVCGRPSQGNYCVLHEPTIDENERNARNPYRRKYRDPEYAKNRQHRFERAHGKCEACGLPLMPAEWECDHLIPLRDGGTNAVENLRVLCKPCHQRKTRLERNSRK